MGERLVVTGNTTDNSPALALWQSGTPALWQSLVAGTVIDPRLWSLATWWCHQDSRSIVSPLEITWPSRCWVNDSSFC